MTTKQENPQEVFKQISELLEKYQGIIVSNKDKINSELIVVTKEYKKGLEHGLKVINDEPSATVDLAKTTDVLEKVAEKSKVIRSNGLKEINRIMNDFCKEVIKVVSEKEKTIYITNPVCLGESIMKR